MDNRQIAEPAIHITCSQLDLDLIFPVLVRGIDVPKKPLSCKVLSLHRGVINLVDHESGLLISLIMDRGNMTAMSLLVPDLFSSETDQSNRDSLLNQICFISMEGKCEDWKGEPPQIGLREVKSIGNMASLLSHLDDGLSFIALLTGKCTDTFQTMGKSILDEKIKIEEKKIRGLEAFIGLGRGMTPSGDDFITGILLAGHSLNRLAAIDLEAIRSRAASTTYGGRTLLTLALKGSFPSYLVTFLNECLRAENDEDRFRAFDNAARHGSTSGRDSLAGFLWFLKEPLLSCPIHGET